MLGKSKLAINKNLLSGTKLSIGNDLRVGKVRGKKNVDLRIKPIGIRLKVKPSIKPRSYKYSPKRRIRSPGYEVAGIRKMNWQQLKKRLPGLSPTADADFDGLINSRDCRPLDPSKDGIFGRILGAVTGGRAGQSKEEYQAEKAEKSRAREKSREAIRGQVEGIAKEVAERQKERSKEKEVEKVQRTEAIERRAKVEAKKQIKRIVRKKGYITKREREEIGQEKETLERFKRSLPVKVATFVASQISKRAPTGKEKKSLEKRRKKGFVRAMETFAGVRGKQKKAKKTAKGQKGIGAGRPKGSYRYQDPRTGEWIPAVTYWKIRKQLKEKAKGIETKAEIQQRFALAKRGLSPEEIAAQQTEINQKMARLRALKAIKQGEIPEGYGVTEEGEIVEMPEVEYQQGDLEEEKEPQYEQQVEQQVEQQAEGEGQGLSNEQLEYERQLQLQQLMQQQSPQQPVQQYQQVQQQQQARSAFNVPGANQVPPGYKLKEDLMTGRKWLEQLPPQEAWTR